MILAIKGCKAAALKAPVMNVAAPRPGEYGMFAFGIDGSSERHGRDTSIVFVAVASGV